MWSYKWSFLACSACRPGAHDVAKATRTVSTTVRPVSYHLWRVVITDCNGVGRGVFYSFIRNESQECYDVAVEHFVRMMCPVNVVRTIVLDKNKSRPCSLKTAMPDAAVIFCSFHVIQRFNAKINKLREVTQSDKEVLFAWSKRMVHCREVSKFEVYATSIKSRNQGFWSYLKPSSNHYGTLFMRVLALASLLPRAENLKSNATPSFDCAFQVNPGNYEYPKQRKSVVVVHNNKPVRIPNTSHHHQFSVEKSLSACRSWNTSVDSDFELRKVNSRHGTHLNLQSKCISVLKRHRAPGPDDFLAVLIKDGGKFLSPRPSSLTVSIWGKETLPYNWVHLIMALIFKNGTRGLCLWTGNLRDPHRRSLDSILDMLFDIQQLFKPMPCKKLRPVIHGQSGNTCSRYNGEACFRMNSRDYQRVPTIRSTPFSLY
ncbi:hypothetical protein CLF_109013 [Clonorchis sinensis]|uniref:ZSWIM1/3 RNaseH-like domain-containing protein n=1 Tax=Clonorchis sinensis TaxID=79923 RepID=G7YS61_CLOSI|nr:hypothetical protein CLF_109013 [Clonorchis sinensis]